MSEVVRIRIINGLPTDGEYVLASHYDALRAQVAQLELALRGIVARWPSTSNPNCDDYERGYGQAVAEAAMVARSALEQSAGQDHGR